MARSRIVPESNYYGFYNRGKTMRCQIDPSKPILPLNPPEIEDVAINNLCHAGCPFCFVGDTLILKSDGDWAPISDIQIGDEVITVDTENGNALVPNVVSQVHVRDYDGEVILLRQMGRANTLTCTPNHEIFTLSRGLSTSRGAIKTTKKSAGTLNDGDLFIEVNSNSRLTVGTWMNTWYQNFTGKVYNLGVENIHNYVANGVLVSNCYVAAEKSGRNFPNIVDKIHDYYGSLPKEHRPFQVAIGGAGEPTLHPELIPAMEAFKSLGITPNYTTNGMHLSAELLEVTRRLGSSVGVSCHPHLDKIWRAAILQLEKYEIKTALHIIVGEPGSAARYYRIMKEFPNVMYYLALPYIPIGRAKPIPVEKEWDELFAGDLPHNAALGAHFYPYLMARPHLVAHHKVSIHEPEIVSGYRMLDDSYRVIRKSSFDPTPKERNTPNV